MYHVEATPSAERALRTVPGLYGRAEALLLDILRAGEDVRRLQAGNLKLDTWLRLHVGDHVVSYMIDLDAQKASILAVSKRGSPDELLTR